MEKLGEGEFGVIYKSLELNSKKHCALKMMKSENSKDEITVEVSRTHLLLSINGFNFLNSLFKP